MRRYAYLIFYLLACSLRSQAQCIDNPDTLLTKKNAYIYVYMMNGVAYYKVRVNDKKMFFADFDTLIKDARESYYEGKMMKLWMSRDGSYKLIYDSKYYTFINGIAVYPYKDKNEVQRTIILTPADSKQRKRWIYFHSVDIYNKELNKKDIDARIKATDSEWQKILSKTQQVDPCQYRFEVEKFINDHLIN